MYRAAVSIAYMAQPYLNSGPNLSRICQFVRQVVEKDSHKHVLAALVGVVGYTVGRHWTVSVTPLDSPVCQELEEDSQQELTRKQRRLKNRQNKNRTGKTYLLAKVIQESTDLAQRIKDEVGTPGLVISVSVDGKEIWSDGLGYADLENRVYCTPDTVMRIASISKPITMAIIARLWQAGKLDLDKPVNDYVTSFPTKEFNGKKVTITTRQLVSHMGGVRHYDKSCKKSDVETSGKEKKEDTDKEVAGTGYDTQIPNNHKRKSDVLEKETKKDNAENKNKKDKSEFTMAEYHIREHYESVTEALKLFQSDALCSKPGTEFYYTTHGWSLVAAVAEGASGKQFPLLMKGLLKDLGLEKTYLDENDSIIYNRARYYVKNDRGRIVNAPFVDCSYKWAGGGLLSTAKDLNKFGNAMLYSYQQPMKTAIATAVPPPDDSANDVPIADAIISGKTRSMPGYLDQTTMEAMWTPVDKTKCSWDSDGSYGMGWGVVPGVVKHGACRDQRFYVSHTGGAIGASSVLLVLPRKPTETVLGDKERPQGVVVAIITNLQSVGLNKVALEIAKKFEQLSL